MNDNDQPEPTREELAGDLLQAAHAFWRSELNAGMPGAVKWLTADDGSMVIFTRGEYREALMRNIEELNAPIHHFEQMSKNTPEPWRVVLTPEGDRRFFRVVRGYGSEAEYMRKPPINGIARFDTEVQALAAITKQGATA